MGTFCTLKGRKGNLRGCKSFVLWWAQQDSNLRPADYEISIPLLFSSVTECDKSLQATTGEGFRRSLIFPHYYSLLAKCAHFYVAWAQKWAHPSKPLFNSGGRTSLPSHLFLLLKRNRIGFLRGAIPIIFDISQTLTAGKRKQPGIGNGNVRRFFLNKSLV